MGIGDYGNYESDYEPPAGRPRQDGVLTEQEKVAWCCVYGCMALLYVVHSPRGSAAKGDAADAADEAIRLARGRVVR